LEKTDLHFTGSKFAEVTIVVTAHLHVEDLGVGDLRVWNEHILEQIEHVLADAIEFRLDHLAILVDQFEMSAAFVSLTVLNCTDGTPRRTSAAR